MILCFCLVILSGCWDRVEMQDLAIVTSAAIDILEDGETRISIQLFIPRTITSGQSGEDPSLGSTFVREGTGDNLANAISKLQYNVPRRLFWGQCKIYILGEDLAKAGIRKEIDYLTRHPGPRGNSLLYVSEGEAKDMLTLIPPLERYSGEALRKLTQEISGVGTTLRDIDIGLMGESESVSIPLIKQLISKEQARKSHETIPIIDGTAVFNKDKMVGTLSLGETRGLLWLKNDIKRSTISVKPEGEDGKISMTSSVGTVKYKPRIRGDRWIMNLNVHIEGDIVQNETHLNLMDERVLTKLKKEYEEALKIRVEQTAEKLQQDLKTDVINFGRKFHQKYPKEWNKVSGSWDEKFPEVEVKINVTAKVRRPGYIGPPAALPRDEVKE
jgi:spore germination protein KC